VEDGEDAESPSPTRAGQHRVREESRCEGGDEVRRCDVGKNETSVLQLRSVGQDNTQHIISVAAAVWISIRSRFAHNMKETLTQFG